MLDDGRCAAHGLRLAESESEICKGYSVADIYVHVLTGLGGETADMVDEADAVCSLTLKPGSGLRIVIVDSIT